MGRAGAGTDVVDVNGLDPVDVLRALYNRAQPRLAGFLRYDPSPMGRETAEKTLGRDGALLDYVKGRAMKIDMRGNHGAIDTRRYDWYNGDGAAAQVVRILRETGDPADARIINRHEHDTAVAAAEACIGRGGLVSVGRRGGFTAVGLGVPDEVVRAARLALDEQTAHRG